jgi:poly(A) polymerase
MILQNMNLKDLLVLLEGRIVGGAVRNKLLGLPINDIDIATPLLPQEVMRRAKTHHLDVKPVGLEFGTVMVVTKDATYEVTSLREDIETDGRHAVVKFGTSFEKDAARRDFTINALSEDAEGRLYDYFNGLQDITAKKIRFIGEAKARIREDYLRILRFFRFTALYGETFDKEGLAACQSEQAGLSRLSPERVISELLKILAAPRAFFALEAMDKTGVLAQILGLPCALTTIKTEEPLLRLAVLCVYAPDDVRHLRRRLKLNNAQTRRLETLAAGLESFPALKTPLEAKKSLYLAGKRTFLDRLTVCEARNAQQDYSWLRDIAQNWHIPTFPLRGEDLKKEGFLEGEAMGLELARRKAAWMANDFIL